MIQTRGLCVWFLGLVLGVPYAVSIVSARPVKLMSLSEQFEQSSLVVIGVAISTADAMDVVPDGTPGQTTDVLTVFEVESVIQGTVPEATRETTRTVTVRHQRYVDPSSEISVVDGPSFIEFDPQKKRRYMMFLKLEGEGIYTPVTGQYDPGMSFSHMQPYQIADERRSNGKE